MFSKVKNELQNIYDAIDVTENVFKDMQARLFYLRDFIDGTTIDFEGMELIEKELKKRQKGLVYKCSLLESELNKATQKFFNSSEEKYPIANDIIEIEPEVCCCLNCGGDLDFCKAFYLYDENHIKIGTFLKCEKCKQYYIPKAPSEIVSKYLLEPHIDLEENPHMKCKSPHCNNTAFYKGLCFECWKHENYEVR